MGRFNKQIVAYCCRKLSYSAVNASVLAYLVTTVNYERKMFVKLAPECRMLQLNDNLSANIRLGKSTCLEPIL
jgi:hypothetical protein